MSSDSLNVVALISGGKDSFFSILHCLKNGHRVIALANLYPDVNGEDGDGRYATSPNQNTNDEEIDSHMYQTVGASIIPLYASALNLPLYRQPISGSAINTSRDYSVSKSTTSNSDSDETESLLPLLAQVLAAHPKINAISTGAILSSYQRTRIESVALRLGLTSLGYLWQYPYLAPYTQDSLLRDMAAVGQDARIIKVASGGLDVRHLWLNVADGTTVRKLAREMGRFGGLVGGSMLGEGGEYETLAVDGPVGVWKKRIVLDEKGRKVCGDGGVWSLRMTGSVIEEKERAEGKGEDEWMERLRVPELFDQEFERLLRSVELEPEGRRWDGEDDPVVVSILHSDTDNTRTTTAQLNGTPLKYFTQSIHTTESTLYISNLHHPPESSTTNTNSTNLIPPSASSLSPATPSTSSSTTTTPPNEQFTTIANQLLHHLSTHGLSPSHITHTTILLRSMSLFSQINTAYATLFTTPNPPSRVTIACGDRLPEGVDVVLSAICHLPRRRQGHGDDGGNGEIRGDEDRIGLHVQSRSYWAPANIGPYSQGISVPIWDDDDDTDDDNDDNDTNGHPTNNSARLIYIAGQIPLIPSTMSLPTTSTSSFTTQAILSLQHLWRIGRVMNVDWWISCVAFITASSPADAEWQVKRVGEVWRGVHAPEFLSQDGDDDGGDQEEEEEEEEDIDIAERSLRGNRPWAVTNSSLSSSSHAMNTHRRALPNCPALARHTPTNNDNFQYSDYDAHLNTNIPPPPTPPIFTAQINSLPRSSSIEWAAIGLEIDKKRAYISRCEEGDRYICHIHDHSGALVLRVVHASVVDEEALMELLGIINISEEPGLVEVFVCDGLDLHFLEDTVRCSVQVIPCVSVWDAEGKNVFAAVRWREHV